MIGRCREPAEDRVELLGIVREPVDKYVEFSQGNLEIVRYRHGALCKDIGDATVQVGSQRIARLENSITGNILQEDRLVSEKIAGEYGGGGVGELYVGINLKRDKHQAPVVLENFNIADPSDSKSVQKHLVRLRELVDIVVDRVVFVC